MLKQRLEGHNKEYQLIIAAYDGGKCSDSNSLLHFFHSGLTFLCTITQV